MLLVVVPSRRAHSILACVRSRSSGSRRSHPPPPKLSPSGRCSRTPVGAITVPTMSELGSNRSRLHRLGAACFMLLVVGVLVPTTASTTPSPRRSAKTDSHLLAQAARHPTARLPVIVRETAPRTSTAERLVRALGGRVTHELNVVGGFSALVPSRAVQDLTASPDVLHVWADGTVR